jgi:hypothetical protein
MRRSYRIAVLAPVALAIAVPGASAAATKLTGQVSNNGTVSLDMAGKKVETLKSGTYSLSVTDKSKKFEFRISGPGLDKTITGDTFMGSKTEKVKLTKGSYTVTSASKPSGKGEKLTFTVS